MKNKILITGTVAFDDIETPFGSSGKVIGGAGTYIALASSLFTKNLAIEIGINPELIVVIHPGINPIEKIPAKVDCIINFFSIISIYNFF